MVKKKEKEYLRGMMVLFIPDNLRIIILKDRVNINGKIKGNTLDNG